MFLKGKNIINHFPFRADVTAATVPIDKYLKVTICYDWELFYAQ